MTAKGKRLKLPRNVNEYKHLIMNTEANEDTIRWMLALRSKNPEIQTKSPSGPPIFARGDPKQRVVTDLLKQSILDQPTLRRSTSSLTQLVRQSNQSQVGFCSNLRNQTPKSKNRWNPSPPKRQAFGRFLPPMRLLKGKPVSKNLQVAYESDFDSSAKHSQFDDKTSNKRTSSMRHLMGRDFNVGSSAWLSSLRGQVQMGTCSFAAMKWYGDASSEGNGELSSYRDGSRPSLQANFLKLAARRYLARKLVLSRKVVNGVPLRPNTDKEYVWAKTFPMEAGSVYTGQLYNHLRDGFGEITYADKSRYVGFWRGGHRHGPGRMVYANTDIAEGEWVDDQQHGLGSLIFADGAVYNGHFENNHIHGQGKCRWTNGREYVGAWVRSQINGKGKMTWPDGRQYIGEYQNDKKNGYGEFRWKSGKLFKGHWLNGLQHGEGEIVDPNGSTEKGIWKEGKRVLDNQPIFNL